MKDITDVLFAFTIVFFLLLLGHILVKRSVDAHFDRRDAMLCESARVSGNEYYLKRCDCFYKGGPITCIYK